MDFSSALKEYEEKGFAIIEGLLTVAEVDDLLKASHNVVENMTIPKQCAVFSTETNQERDEYFLNSGDNISYFFEQDAVDEKGNLCIPKDKSLNKVGHALHWLNPCFKRVTFSEKIKTLLKKFQYIQPVAVQSMVIFKHPKIGGQVTPHQDSTFLYTEPPSAIGFWFPLVDVNEGNGCLWFLPGSHKNPIYQRFLRNPNLNPLLVLQGEMPIFKDQDYVPAIMKKGDCIIIHGSVIHKSGINVSSESRPVYTFHVVEQKDKEYSKANWLQPSQALPFPAIYSNKK